MSKGITTNRDMQRVLFIENLYASLQKTAKIMDNNEKFLRIAQSYIEDGLTNAECIELLVIDGLSREAAISCVESTEDIQEDDSDLSEYSFQFEDNGRVWSSYDLGYVVKAASDEDAFIKAEKMITEEKQTEDVSVLSVNKIS